MVLLIMGWGIFNVVEGTINHQLLQIHRVREDVDNPLVWDIGFLILGASMIIGGWMISTRADWDSPANHIEEPPIQDVDTDH